MLVDMSPHLLASNLKWSPRFTILPIIGRQVLASEYHFRVRCPEDKTGKL